MNDKDKKRLKGTECLKCPFCEAPQTCLGDRTEEVLCSDGIMRPVVRAGSTCSERAGMTEPSSHAAYAFAD